MRVVLSDDIPDGMHTVKRYTLAELVCAHAALDALTDMRELAAMRRERDRRHKATLRRRGR